MSGSCSVFKYLRGGGLREKLAVKQSGHTQLCNFRQLLDIERSHVKPCSSFLCLLLTCGAVALGGFCSQGCGL